MHVPLHHRNIAAMWQRCNRLSLTVGSRFSRSAHGSPPRAVDPPLPRLLLCCQVAALIITRRPCQWAPPTRPINEQQTKPGRCRTAGRWLWSSWSTASSHDQPFGGDRNVKLRRPTTKVNVDTPISCRAATATEKMGKGGKNENGGESRHKSRERRRRRGRSPCRGH